MLFLIIVISSMSERQQVLQEVAIDPLELRYGHSAPCRKKGELCRFPINAAGHYDIHGDRIYNVGVSTSCSTCAIHSGLGSYRYCAKLLPIGRGSGPEIIGSPSSELFVVSSVHNVLISH